MYASQLSPSIEMDKPWAAGSGHLARGLIAAEEIQMNDIKLKCQRHAAQMQFYDQFIVSKLTKINYRTIQSGV